MDFANLKAQYAALKPSIDARVQRVLDHGQYIMGPEVAELESALAAYVGVRHAITVASGTEALVIALMALGVGPGDEVITSPFTFAASAEAIVLVGATPVFVDVELHTGLIDVALIEGAINARTKAIMPISLYGQCADMPAITAIAARHGLAVVEDAAQSFGATLEWAGEAASSARTRRSGGMSHFGATSFFPSKPLGCYGDGGALFTDDDALATAAREIRVHGQSRRYHHTRIGVGGRMDTLQCAVVLAKLERFDWELAQRQRLAARYDRALAALPGVGRLRTRAGCSHVHAQYTIVLKDRDAVAAALKLEGIPTAVHYPLGLHRQPAYAAWAPNEPCARTDALAQGVLSLPMSADLSDAEQDQVIDALRRHVLA